MTGRRSSTPGLKASAGGFAIAGPHDHAGAALRALLHQHAIGLSVHRLYAGDVRVAAVRDAYERIHVTAQDVLDAGPLEVSIRSGRFSTDEGPIAGQELDRLAQACFERRLEHLGLAAAPTVEELAAWFEALSTDPEQLRSAGGVPALLHARGVTAIVASEDAPDPTSGEEVEDELLASVDRTDAIDTGRIEQALAMRVHPGEPGQSLYERLRETAAHLPEDDAARSPFYRHAADLVADLAPAEQAAFGRVVIDAAEEEPFAERYVGHLPDLALAELLVRVAEHEGTHPSPLAQRLSEVCGRHANLGRITLDLSTGVSEEPPEDGFVPPQGTHPLATAFPEDDDDGRSLALTALLDFLANGPRADQVAAVLEAATERLRDDLGAGRRVAVEALLRTLEDAAVLVDRDLAARLRRPRTETLDVDTVRRVLHGPRDPTLLEPFGASALPPLLMLLDPQHPAPTRTAAAGALASVAVDHLDALASAVARQPEAIVAELVAVVARLPDAQALPLLSRLAHHRSPRVLSRLVAALDAHDPVTAAPILAAICARCNDRDVRRRCVDALGRHRLGTSRDILARLARRSSSPLPWSLRRRARAVLRHGGRRS